MFYQQGHHMLMTVSFSELYLGFLLERIKKLCKQTKCQNALPSRPVLPQNADGCGIDQAQSFNIVLIVMVAQSCDPGCLW